MTRATPKAYVAPALVESGKVVHATRSVSMQPPVDNDRTYLAEAEGSVGFAL